MKTKTILIGAGLGAAAGLLYGLTRREAQAAPPPPLGPFTPPSIPPRPGTPTTMPPSQPKPPYIPPPTTGGTKPVAFPTSEGQAFFDALSPSPVTRTKQLYAAIKSMKLTRGFDVPSADIEMTDSLGNHGIVTVTCDAVKLYGVRFSVDAYHSQLFADLFGAVMMTQKVSDEMWRQAKYKPAPTTLGDFGENTNTMATTRAMLKANAKIDERLAALGFDPEADYNAIIGNPGKDWLLSGWYWLPGKNIEHCATTGMKNSVENIESGVNYGLYGSGGGFKSNGHGFSVIQGAANCHGYEHVDYSQVLRLIAGTMTVNGEPNVPVSKVLTSPDLAGLLSYEGALPGYRHPGVPLDSSVGGGILI